MNWIRIHLLAGLLAGAASSAVTAVDINERLSVEGLLAAAWQYQDLSEQAGASDTGRGGLVAQTGFAYQASERDDFYLLLGFAADDGLNPVSPFNLPPWAASLEDDVRDINGRDRDYLLAAWYRHRFPLQDGDLGLTFGIIDATDYLDDNAYANDEYTQFMNTALVNGPNVFGPSYDIGAAAEWDAGRYSVRGVVMRVGENDAGNGYNFFGAQFGYTVETGMGEGNYRIAVLGTSDDFPDDTATRNEGRLGVVLSFDQQFGDTLGGFLRIGWQDDAAAVDYEAIYSGGLDIRGGSWGRADDNIGLGYAYMDGANSGIDSSHVAEAYYRLVVNDFLALTADVQYMEDDLDAGRGPEGVIWGIRGTAEF